MKKLLLSVAILLSLQSFSQDTTYNDAIKFNMTDSVEDNFTFKRKATFEALVINPRTKEIQLQFRVKFFGNNIEVKAVQPYSKTVSIPNDLYVVSATGVFVGNISDVLVLYGKKNPDSSYIKFPDGRYDLTTACQGWYDYIIINKFEVNNKLQVVIKAIGVQAAAEGKLN